MEADEPPSSGAALAWAPAIRGGRKAKVVWERTVRSVVPSRDPTIGRGQATTAATSYRGHAGPPGEPARRLVSPGPDLPVCDQGWEPLEQLLGAAPPAVGVAAAEPSQRREVVRRSHPPARPAHRTSLRPPPRPADRRRSERRSRARPRRCVGRPALPPATAGGPRLGHGAGVSRWAGLVVIVVVLAHVAKVSAGNIAATTPPAVAAGEPRSAPVSTPQAAWSPSVGRGERG